MKHWDPVDLASTIRSWIASNPDVDEITVPMMQRLIGGDRHLPPHFVEQAFQILNRAGELSHRGPRRSPCACGDHRAARYFIRRQEA